MKILITGINPIGLSLAVILAKNHEVIMVDSSIRKVAEVNLKKCPFENINLSNALSAKNLTLTATVDIDSACETCDYVFISNAVSYNEGFTRFNTLLIDNIISRIVYFNNDAIIAIRSTIPVGYINNLCKKYKTDRFVYYPEFIRENFPVRDTTYPSRIILGTDYPSAKTDNLLELLVSSFNKKNIPTFIIPSKEAESTKLFANTFFAIKSTFFNDITLFSKENFLDESKIIECLCFDTGKNDVADYKNIRGLYELSTKKNSLIKETKESAAPHKVNERKEKEKITEKIIKSNATETVGLYCLSKYKKFDCHKKIGLEELINFLISKNKNVIIFDPTMREYDFYGARIICGLENFKNLSDIIVTDKLPEELSDVTNKLRTPKDLLKLK